MSSGKSGVRGALGIVLLLYFFRSVRRPHSLCASRQGQSVSCDGLDFLEAVLTGWQAWLQRRRSVCKSVAHLCCKAPVPGPQMRDPGPLFVRFLPVPPWATETVGPSGTRQGARASSRTPM